MAAESTGRKIWRVIYPVIALFVLYFGVIFGSMMFFSSASLSSGGLDASMEKNFSIVTVIALVLITVVEYLFFRRDYVEQSWESMKKPGWLLFLILFGAAASHGLNLLVSLFNINGIFGSYEAVEAEIFAPGVIFVIIRALILAPIAEELVFRALVFRRMKEYTSFWPAALVSSALFGLYHMNLGQGIYAFLFGILLAFLYDRFRNFLAPMLVHFGANLLSVILQYAKAEYPSMVVYIIMMVVMFAASAAAVIFVIRKMKA